MEKNTQIGNASTLQIIRLWLGRFTSPKAYCNDQEKLQNIKNETKGEQNFYLLGSLQKAISKLLEIIEI